MKNMNNLINLSKKTLLITVCALTLNSCADEYESGIVKDKIDNKVYLTPVDYPDVVWRVINFDCGVEDEETLNLYLNMNIGDTIKYVKKGSAEIMPSYHQKVKTGIFGDRWHVIYYNVHSINGVNRLSLPNLVRQKRELEEIKRLQEEYKKAKQK